MIGRMWTARATAANAQAYREHFEASVLPSVRGLDGYAGGSLLLSDRDGDVDIVVITRWRTIAAIRAFAGADIEAAVVAEAAQRLLTSWDRRVRHYTIAVDDGNDR